MRSTRPAAPWSFIPVTNAIESINYQLRKITKNRGHFPNDEAAMKLLYLGLRNISSKRGGESGTGTWGWKMALNTLVVLFPGDFPCDSVTTSVIRGLHGNHDRPLSTEMRVLRGANSDGVIRMLNPIIAGWAAFYRIGVSSRAFQALDHHVWRLTYKWSTGSRTRTSRGAGL